MRFTLEIELGNDAMQTWNDLSHAMRGLMRTFDTNGNDLGNPYPGRGDDGKVKDENGNTVGRWTVTA